MANELHAETATGSVIYCVVIDSVGRIWNATLSALEAINPANWTDYAIGMTEATAGIYQCNMPALVNGPYSYIVYTQAGANPAITDVSAGTGAILWNGTAEIGDQLEERVEGLFTLRETMRIVSASLAGKLSGGGTATVTYRAIDDSADRIVATITNVGNRTLVVLTP